MASSFDVLSFDGADGSVDSQRLQEPDDFGADALVDAKIAE